MMEDDKLCSPKTFSAATSPIKETIRHGSRELVKKLISRDVQTEKYAGGFNSSSSSEKVDTIKNIHIKSKIIKTICCLKENVLPQKNVYFIFCNLLTFLCSTCQKGCSSLVFIIQSICSRATLEQKING